jgi:hypothetical protein
LVQGQALVALASGESEFYGMVRGAIESIFCAHILAFFEHDVEQILESDSSAARGAARRIGVGKRMKHLHQNKLFIQDLVANDQLTLEKVHKDKNVSDVGTKHVNKATLERLIKILGGFWLEFGVKIGEGVKIEDKEYYYSDEIDESTMVPWSGTAYETVYYYYQIADLKTLMLLTIIISVMTQVVLKLIENAILNRIGDGISESYRKILGCCRRKAEDTNENLMIEIFTTTAATTTCHLHRCQFVNKMRDPKSYRICSDCDRYLKSEMERVVNLKIDQIL